MPLDTLLWCLSLLFGLLLLHTHMIGSDRSHTITSRIPRIHLPPFDTMAPWSLVMMRCEVAPALRAIHPRIGKDCWRANNQFCGSVVRWQRPPMDSAPWKWLLKWPTTVLTAFLQNSLSLPKQN
uniref:Putative secreted protein n=1 Tax=Anopheles darlingi TaxID=43151 RepID=A0A2M4DKL6_ANODA